MRRAALALFLISFSAVSQFPVFATGSVTLAWSPSSDPNVVGFKIYYGVASHVYTNVVDAGSATNLTINGLVDGTTYYFAATAYNSLGIESDFSNETSYSVPGTPPGPNHQPTLNPLSNVMISESASQQTVNLSGITSGSTNENQTLTVTATSSNPALIPNPTITYTSPNTNGTLRFTPVAFGFGSATISVTVNDGQTTSNTITRTFTVTVLAINQAPTLNALGNLTINENAGQQTVNLSGITSGMSNEIQTLTVTATSGNTGVVPNPTVTYTSPNTTGSLTFTPVGGAAGSALITVTVNDNAASNNLFSRTFTVTVNARPTISAITNVTIATNTSSGAIPFTIGDAETPAANLTLRATSSATSLIPTNNIVFGGSGSNRTVTLTPLAGQSGNANISIFVSDGAATNSTTFQLSVLGAPLPPTLLTIITNGSGSVSLNSKSPNLAMGKTYTLTAVPAKGQIFAGWSGDLHSSSTKVSFLMESNMTVQANFIPNPYVPVVGSYNGLCFDTNSILPDNAGSFSVKVSVSGTYSGKLQLGAAHYSFSGKLDATCRATNTIVRAGATPLTLDFRVGMPADEISGHLTDGIWMAGVSGDRAVFNVKTNPAPFAGSYTLVVAGQNGNPLLPAGSGYGSLRVDAAGKIKFVGTLADGTKVSQSTVLSKNGEWPLFASLYSGGGLAIGWIDFADQAGSDFTGPLVWIKPASATGFYPAGFTSEFNVTGSAFVPPVGANGILNFTTGSVTFDGGNLLSNFSTAISLDGTSVTDVGGHELTMTFSSSTGIFTGKVTDPSTSVSLSFSGAVLQKANAGYGFMPGADQSSAVSIAP